MSPLLKINKNIARPSKKLFLCLSIFVFLFASTSRAMDTISPLAITDLKATTWEQIKLTWTAPGDDGMTETASGYIVKYSTVSNFTDQASFDAAREYPQSWTPAQPGTIEVKTLTGLKPRTTYYFAIEAYDEVSNQADLSNTIDNNTLAGNFYETKQNLAGIMQGMLAWGDYDNDGDLDLVLTGWDGRGKSVSKIYRNDKGTLVFSQDLRGLYWSSVTWGDYDSDGDLDLILTGFSEGTFWNYSIMYKNTNGIFTEDSKQNLMGICEGYATWGDYDNDGDLDLALVGWNGVNAVSKIYRNDNGILNEDTSQSLIGLYGSWASWCDYDMDGDLDLIIAGLKNLTSERITKLYRNDNGILRDSGESLIGVCDGSISWADYDADGDLDLFIIGYSNSGRISRLYENDNGTLIEKQNLVGVEYGSIAWGDYDNDGDLDLALAGSTDGIASGAIFYIYANQNGTLVQTQALTGITWSSIAWGDYDDDGDLDLVASGISKSGEAISTTIYRNNEAEFGVINTAPNPPTGGFASAYRMMGKYALVWSQGSDVESSDPDELYYNIRVATFSAGNSKISGVYGSPLLGNYLRPKVSSSQLGVYLKNITEGTTYYWNVQTIDAGLRKSDWSEEQVVTPNEPPSGINNLKASVGEQIRLTWSAPRDDDFDEPVAGYIVKYFTVSNFTDQASFDAAPEYPQSWAPRGPGSEEVKTLTGLKPGTTYYFAIEAYDEAGNQASLSNTTGNSCIAGYFIKEKELEGICLGTVSWGDYDNDGDLDMVVAGQRDPGNIVARVYRNDNGSFSIVKNLDGVKQAYVDWIDYDNDGDLDIALSGLGSNWGVTKIYNNDSGSFVEDKSQSLPQTFNHSFAWGDYDNDGDLDLVLAGKLFLNDNGILNESQSNIFALGTSFVAAGDYDNDGDLDIAITGTSGSNIIGKIYENENGYFTEGQTFINWTRLDWDNSLAWGDYDNDGDLDLAWMGDKYPTGRCCKMYRNDNGIFTEDQTLASVSSDWRGIAFGDYDNDGDLDLAITGWGGGTIVYRNNEGTFVETHHLDYATWSNVSWADYDNDGDLDLAVVGLVGGKDKIFYIYKNYAAEYGVVNTTPAPPTTGFESTGSDGEVTLCWGNGSDIESAEPNELYYNLRMGTTPGSQNIVSAVYGTPLLGNYTRMKSITLNVPDDVTYYWSVQTIDAGLRKSNWSNEQTVYCPPQKSPSPIMDLSAIYYGLMDVRLDWTATGDDGTIGDITDGKYCIKYSTNATDGWNAPYSIQWSTDTKPGNLESKMLSCLIEGTSYYFWIKLADEIPKWSLISNTATVWLQGIPPAAITDLTAYTGLKNGEINLQWTAPRDDGTANNNFQGHYIIKYSSNGAIPSTVSWDEAKEFVQNWIPLPVGTLETHTITGLIPGTIYWVAIKTQDEVPNISDIDITPIRASARANAEPIAPTNFEGVAISTSEIKWSWKDNYDYEDGFLVQTSTQSVSETLSKNTTFWIELGLLPNTEYTRHVKTFGPGGDTDSNENSCYTLANLPTDLKIIAPYANAITLSWNTNDNPSSTRFGLAHSRDNFIADISNVIVFASNLTASRTIVYGLSADTTYWFRVWAYNEDGIKTNYAEPTTAKTAAAGYLNPPHTTYTKEIVTIDGQRIIITVPVTAFDVPTIITANLIDTEHPKFEIVKDADKETRYIEVTKPYELIVKDNLGNILGPNDFKDNVQIEFTFPSSFNLAQKNLLRIFRLNEIARKWEEQMDYRIDASNNKIALSVDHFSVFEVMQKITFGFSGLIVYPDPFKAKEAKDECVKFINLPKEVIFRIYNIAGELVYKKEYEDTQGGITWDGKNNDGRKVATDVYIYLLEDNNGHKKKGKLLVIQ